MTIESLDQFEFTQTNIFRISEEFRTAGHPQLERVFKEAVHQMEFDTEMLRDFYDFYQDYLKGDNPYGSIEFESARFPQGDERRISKLVNQDHCLVDCHMLSMLAIDNCLEVYNHLADEHSPYDASWILDLTCEASEAVALARISTATIDLYYDVDDSKQALEPLKAGATKRQQNLDIGNEQQQAKRDRTKSVAVKICEQAWVVYPDLRIGPLAEMITEAFRDPERELFRAPKEAGPQMYGRVKKTNLVTHLNSVFPQKKSTAGRPPKAEQTNVPQVEAKIFQLLENIVKKQ